MIIREITDLKGAELYWRALSPRETIFDEWDFRYSFYKLDPYPILFLAAFDNPEADGSEQAIGLMPLELHPKHGYEFFAEDPSEESRPFVKAGRENIIPALYEAIPGPAKCFDITGSDEFTAKLPLEDYKYLLPLNSINSWEDYLHARLSAKKQRNFRSDRRKAEAYEPKVFYNRPEDLEAVFKLNSASFSDSYLQTENDRRGWSDLLETPFDWQIIGIEIGGEVKAAALSVLYQGKFFYLINGADRNFPGLGKYLNMVSLERAIALGASIWDAGLGDCNWKESWHLDKKPQYEFIKK